MSAFSRTLDRLGILVTGICFVQCLATPVLIVLAPTLFGTLLDGHHFHFLLLFLILPISGIALFLGCTRHRNLLVISAGLSGLILVCLAAWLGYEVLGRGGEMAMTLTGSGLLALAHVFNYRLCRNPQRCEEHADDHDH